MLSSSTSGSETDVGSHVALGGTNLSRFGEAFCDVSIWIVYSFTIISEGRCDNSKYSERMNLRAIKL